MRMNKPLYELTVKEALELLAKGTITAVELTEACLNRIKEKDTEIKAFLTVTEEYALTRAKLIDEKRKKGEKLGALAGIPYSLKDVYVTKGIRTTAGSKILDNYIPQYDATVQKMLEAADAILIGKTNCDPFGFGSSTENSSYGPTRNPINPDYVPGGSSGGSGAAVRYGGGIFSIGEDTGGSNRCPAAFCGLVGIKPTYGRVSRYGSIAYASSYDTVGPITKTAEDAAIIMDVIIGVDPKDATTSPILPEKQYTEYLNNEIKGKKIGIPKEYFGEGLAPEVRELIEAAIEKYRSMGCIIVDISLPYTEYAIAAYYLIGLSEASTNLARFDGIRYGIESEGSDWKEKVMDARANGFTAEVKRRIMVGTYALSAGYSDKYYKRAQKVREFLKADFRRAFTEVDVILTPTMPTLPFKIGEKTSDPLSMWLADAYTVTINPVGIPAFSIPAGYARNGLPVGMQLIGPHFSEPLLFNFAHKFENYGI